MVQRKDWLKILLLSIVTCGIYGIVFFYQYGEDTNKVCAGDGKNTMNYLLALLLSAVTCGIFGLVWLYQVFARLEPCTKKAQSPIVSVLILCVPVYSFYYMCDVMNDAAQNRGMLAA